MATTTIRVHTSTHARLIEMSNESGATLLDTVDDATSALSRERFARKVSGEFARLKKDSPAWDDYVSEADQTAVGDGVR